MAATIKELLLQIDCLKDQIDSMRPLKPEQEGQIRQKFRLDWNYHSNAIEGNKLTQGETRVFLMEGLTAQGKPLKDHLDIRGHNEVIDFLLAFIDRRAELSEADIREMHKILLVESYKASAVTPDGKPTEKWIKLGQYKDTPNQVTTSTGEIRRFVLPQDTPAKMGDLMKAYRKEVASKELHPVQIAAFFHHQFVAIHPFDDGNGRMARILMNLVLMQNGFPPVVIKLEDRDRYFAALGRADSGEREDFDQFIAEKLLSSLVLYLKGACGEPIEEDDDIDKKIALLKQGLTHVPEPKVLSFEVYQDFLKKNLLPLISKVFSKMEKFNDLFLENQISLMVNNHHFDLKGSLEQKIVEALAVALKAQKPGEIKILFRFQTFKKAGIKSFSYHSQSGLTIAFGTLSYRVEWEKPNNLVKLYSSEITDDECTEIAKDLAEHCLKFIQKQLN